MIYLIMKNRNDFLSIDAIRFGWNGLWKDVRFFVILTVIITVLYSLPSLFATYVLHLERLDNTISYQVALERLLLMVASLIIYLILELGLLRIALNFRDNSKAELGDLFREYPKLIKYIAASILFGLMVILPLSIISFGLTMLKSGNYGTAGTVISFILSIIILVAAVYLFLKYQFYGYLIVDRGSGPVEALKESSRLTEGMLKNLLIFWVEMWLVVIFIQWAVSIVVFIAEIPINLILYSISEDLVSLTESIISSAIRIFVSVPIIKLATADIYRRLVNRSGGWALPAASG